MVTAQTNRQLLLGMLAVQLDFISGEQLTTAVDTWRRDKSQTMETILVNRGYLSDDDRQLLAPLATRHIELHAGDANRSLSSLGIADGLAEALQALGDEAIDETVSYASSQRSTKRLDETAVYAVAADSTASPGPVAVRGRFRKVRPYARGGLGEVSIAQDTELNREVA
jgi:hypothetical protein